MQTHEIRKRFLDHFVKAGHTEVPSASVILDDPNLLFVNAGMVQFVPFFLGQRTPPYDKATSVQKCIRTPDIDEVGITTRHNTFFQMAGNFSFGDYFKRGAIELAWALLTNPVDAGRLRVRSREAVGHGLSRRRRGRRPVAGDRRSAAERIQRRGMADNYWSMGIPGPCGPSSEIYYDRGPEYGVDGGPMANEDRYIEIWNLVFMQNERGEGTCKDDFEILGPLPRKNIDTGMGVERVACLLQGVDNVYETDLLRPVIDMVAAIAPTRIRRGQPRRRRPLPDHRRPQPHRGDHHRRRRHARQRRPRLRAAPAAAPGHPLGQAARHRHPDHGRPDGHGARRDGTVVPRTGHRLRPDQPDRGRRGDGVQPHPGVGLAAVRRRRADHQGRR